MIGRGPELRTITAALGAARRGGGAGVLLVGEAGIGKTALLSAARAEATGMRVAEARMVEPEAGIAYAGLSAIAAAIPGAMAGISPDARSVLSGVLGLGPPRIADPLAVAGAVLALLSAAAAAQPLCVIVDDAHWLDPETAVALTLCARRIVHDAICLLAAGRSPAITGSPLMASFTPIPVGGLPDEDARVLLDAQGHDLTPQVAALVLATARGNPLALVEIPTALTAAQRNASAPLPDPLPTGPQLEGLFAARAAELSEPARTALLILAASADEDPGLVIRAMPDPAALEEARKAGLIGADGPAFRHPLVRSGVYGAADPAARRDAHRRLAKVLIDDPPARARHLAAAQLEADEAVAAELEAAGMLALARLGTSSAVGLLARSAELSVTSEARVGRLTAAAQAAFMGGAFPTSLELLGAAAAEQPTGVPRARVEHLRGQVHAWLGPASDAERIFVDGAHGAAADDPALAASLLIEAAFVVGGMLGETAKAEQIAEEACALATGAGPLEMVARFVRDFTRCVRGAPLDAGMSQHFESLERVIPLASSLSTTLSLCGQAGALSDHPLASIPVNAALASRFRAAGLAVSAIFPELSVGMALMRGGRLPEARSSLLANAKVAEELGLGPYLSLGLAYAAHASALMGDPDAAELARRARAAGAASHTLSGVNFAAHALATVDVARGRYSQALPVLEAMKIAVWDDAGMESPEICPFGVDLVEALVGVGRYADAEVIAERIEGQAARAPTLAARAHATTARGLVTRSDAAAADLLVEAIRLGEVAGRPIDAARSRLLLGPRLTADGDTASARQELREGLRTFDAAAASPFARRARGLLRSLGDLTDDTPQAASPALSPQEMQVALLVTEGLSNTEIGERLFITRRTVEFHLTNTYRKLDLRGRAALAAEMSRRASHAAAP